VLGALAFDQQVADLAIELEPVTGTGSRLRSTAIALGGELGVIVAPGLLWRT
jgi:hypothetical protein